MSPTEKNYFSIYLVCFLYIFCAEIKSVFQRKWPSAFCGGNQWSRKKCIQHYQCPAYFNISILIQSREDQIFYLNREFTKFVTYKLCEFSIKVKRFDLLCFQSIWKYNTPIGITTLATLEFFRNGRMINDHILISAASMSKDTYGQKLSKRFQRQRNHALISVKGARPSFNIVPSCDNSSLASVQYSIFPSVS